MSLIACGTSLITARTEISNSGGRRVGRKFVVASSLNTASSSVGNGSCRVVVVDMVCMHKSIFKCRGSCHKVDG